ncbi:hypothetical protein [Ruegeria sp. A3M17]|uniref:hypothetical protein n=1 Tax=Ruegeria sp. A3M17 TaxID=2267229 RepID=UPI000DE96F8C|nr:hypothetical protein [Ruegeria sp. A3M17]RBW54736.1 hypothetical protein DS906_14400 [Ruegeria sp. A3M17]
MKALLSALAFVLLGHTTAIACTNMNRLPVFNYKKHASGNADFYGVDPKKGRSIIIRHTDGISRIDIRAKRGAKDLYTKSGTGSPLPVTVTVTENLCVQGSKKLFTKKFHARLKEQHSTQFFTPFVAKQNKDQAISLAQSVLRATYCPKGEIALNHKFQYVDKSGNNPVVKTAPAARAWGADPFDEEWIIQLTCSEWRSIQ